MCSGRGVSLLVRGCPALRTIVVNQRATICESTRDLVSLLRPEVKLLVHNTSTEYDILCMDIELIHVASVMIHVGLIRLTLKHFLNFLECIKSVNPKEVKFAVL